MRVPFHSVFTQIDGRIIPKNHTALGNITFAAGAPLDFQHWRSHFEKFKDCDLSVQNEDGIVVIVGFYQGNDINESLV